MCKEQTVKIVCDRCKETIDGLIYIDEDIESISYTAGFYDISGWYWHKYANPNEMKICDDCMHSDPRYQKEYLASCEISFSFEPGEVI